MQPWGAKETFFIKKNPKLLNDGVLYIQNTGLTVLCCFVNVTLDSLLVKHFFIEFKRPTQINETSNQYNIKIMVKAFPTCFCSIMYYVFMIWSYQGWRVAGAGTVCLCVVVTGLRVPQTVCPGVFERVSEDDDSLVPLAGYRCALYLQDEHSVSPSMHLSRCDLTYPSRSSWLD